MFTENFRTSNIAKGTCFLIDILSYIIFQIILIALSNIYCEQCIIITLIIENRKLISWFLHQSALVYSKCSEILNTNCLLKRPRQKRQTQIRLLLKKQSDQGLLYLLL